MNPETSAPHGGKWAGFTLGCGSLAPLLSLSVLLSSWIDPFLLSFAMFLVSFVLPVAIALLLVHLLKSPASRTRAVVTVLCGINVVILVYMLYQKALIWQWWLFPG